MTVNISGATIAGGVNLGDYVPVVTGGLQLLLDAGNTSSYSGTGTTWNDISGNGKNFSWTTTPSFTSAGTASYFSTSNLTANGPASNSFGVTNLSGYCVIVACMVNTVQQATSFNWDGGGGRGIYSHLPWSGDTIYWDQGGCCEPDTRTFVYSGGSTTWNIWGLNRTSSTNRSIYKNGTILTTNTAVAADPALNANPVIINVIGASVNWDARLGVMMLYNRGLTDAEMMQNVTALRVRYGV
jgi:hypothetical protein